MPFFFSTFELYLIQFAKAPTDHRTSEQQQRGQPLTNQKAPLKLFGQIFGQISSSSLRLDVVISFGEHAFSRSSTFGGVTHWDSSPSSARYTGPMGNGWGLEGWRQISDEGINPGMDRMGGRGWGRWWWWWGEQKRENREKETMGEPNKVQSMVMGS